MKYIELFAGIGGMGHGLMQAGMECVGYCELDKYAHKAFQLLHDPEERMWNAYDVRSVADDDIEALEGEKGKIQLLAAGFPCTTFSIAGKREGFADQTRGTLFFEVIRYASLLRPSLLLLENVKGLLNHDGGRTFATILCALDELGYDCQWQLLNSKGYVAQNRERVFIVGHSRDRSRPKVFPFGRENTKPIEVLGSLEGKFEHRSRVYGINGIAPTLSTMCGGSHEPKILVDGRVRKLTPLEFFRLQGFPDEWYHTLKEHGISNSQLYKMAGNAVTSEVAYEIGVRLMRG